MISNRIIWIASLIELAGLGFAQSPAIRANGVVNAASYDSRELAPRSLITIFGTNLASSTSTANMLGLPISLAGTTVQIGGIPAPLVYVSPTQINAQMPSALSPGTPIQAQIIVTTSAGSSAPAAVTISPRAFGVFSLDTSGCGHGAVLNVHRDGSTSINTPQHSFDPTSDLALAVFGTGLGVFHNVPDAVPFVNDPKKDSGGVFTGVVGFPDSLGATHILTSLYTGPAPGLIGQDQLNLQDPAGGSNLPQGCNVPLYLTDFAYSASQAVSVSIHSGGGQCVDPAADSFGIIEFVRVATTDNSGTSESEGIELKFERSPGLHFPTVPQENTSDSGPLLPTPLQCADNVPQALGAGPVSVHGPGVSIVIDPIVEDGVLIYRVTLPPASLQGGAYQITGSGGSDVGAFAVTANLPVPIAITDTLSPGTVVEGSQLNLHWTGSDAQSVLEEQLFLPSNGIVQVASAAVAAATGVLTVPVWRSMFPVSSGATYPTGGADIVLTVQPDATHVQSFTAPGLTLGGQVRWRYEYHYNGLVVH